MLNHRSARYQLFHKAAGAVATPAALSYVGYDINDLSSGTTEVVPVPAGVQDGDLMLLCSSHNADVSYTPPAGWTLVQEITGADGIHVLYRIADSEPTDYTVTYGVLTNVVSAIVAFRSTGGKSILVDDSTENDSTVSGTEHNAPSVTTSDVNAMLVCFASWSGTEPGGLTADATMTERYESSNGSNIQFCMTANQESAGATGTKTVTGAGNSRTAKLVSVALIEDV